MYTRLGMGHTHSAVILLLINFRAVDIVIKANLKFQNCVLLNLRANRARRVMMLKEVVAVYIHIDDFGFFSASIAHSLKISGLAYVQF